MTIIEKVRAKKAECLTNPAVANANALKAAMAIQGGIGSAAWEVYMEQFAENVDQLRRLKGTDGTLGHEGLSIKRAYLAANAMCGAGSTDDLDRKVETIDEPPS